MARKILGKSDPVLEQIADALGRYEAAHPQAQIELYRKYPYSVRIRIVDPDLAAVEEADRFDVAWSPLETLPNDVLNHVGLVFAHTPDEMKDPLVKVLFGKPPRSRQKTR